MTQKVEDPSGREWTVRRKWVPRRLRWRGRTFSFDLLDGAELLSFGDELPVVGVIFAAIAAFLVAVGLVVLVLPAVVFILELLLIATLVGLGVLGRVLLGRPWTIEARQKGADHALEWRARGWQGSQEVLESVAQQIAVNGTPAGGARVPPAP